MRSWLLPTRVVHVHLTRVCNLACAHCYSSSGPSSKGGLDLGSTLDALSVLRAHHYEVVSVSGGEPFVYPELDEFIRGSANLGYQINLVTNGTLISEARLQRILGYLNLVAVSLDGAPDRHNAIRGRPDAFSKACAGIEVLRTLGVPFAISFCVSGRSLPDLQWVYEFSDEVGAKILHLHPLVMVGRAKEECTDIALRGTDRARLFLAAEILNTRCKCPRVQVDLAPVDELVDFCEQLSRRGDTQKHLLSDVVNPLVLDEKGRLFPFAYGIDQEYLVGRIGKNLSSEISKFLGTAQGGIKALVEAASIEARASQEQFVEWYEHMVTASQIAGSRHAG